MNWNPFSRAPSERRQQKERVRLIEKELSSNETKMYSALFELDDMVRRSLALLEPKKNEPDRH